MIILNVVELSSGVFIAVALLAKLFYWIGFGNSKEEALNNLYIKLNERRK